MVRSAFSPKLAYAAILFGFLVASLHAQDRTTGQEPVRLVVRVRTDAQVRIDGTLTKTTGEVRHFVSPPLDVGSAYTYTISAVWEPNNYTTVTRTRRVIVRPGQETEMDLRYPDSKQPDDIVIRYVPTPPEVVDGMLRLAGVGKDDVVYDLGCGDGRIVVAAVSKFGAKRGVGVDLNPQRLKECADNARRAGVTDRVEFRQGDVLKIEDLSQATVVTLYMSEEINLRLRPILQETLKPGARIVTHQFAMGNWKPAKEETITGEDNAFPYKIFLWTIGP